MWARTLPHTRVVSPSFCARNFFVMISFTYVNSFTSSLVHNVEEEEEEDEDEEGGSSAFSTCIVVKFCTMLSLNNSLHLTEVDLSLSPTSSFLGEVKVLLSFQFPY